MLGKLHLLLVLGIALCLGTALLLRRDFREPNYELVPERQMALSPAYGAYAPNPNFPDGLTFRQPPPGTIARGSQAFPYGPTPAEAARAGQELENPFSVATPEARKQAEALYATYCLLCHGKTGMGDGKVSGRGFPAPLSFLKPQAMEMKDGTMFHILTYGKGNMPAHNLQLSPDERWLTILHVRVLQNKYTEVPNVRLADTVQIYKAQCAACHGEDGAGSLLRAKLPNLPDFSSLAWQLSKTNLELSNRIEYGDEPLMPSFRYRLPHDQILALAIYVRSFAMVKEGSPAPKPALPPTAAGLTPVQIFRAYCLACHNVDGKGAIVRPGMPDIPDFTLASWQGTKTDAELSKSILGGGKFMPSMKDKLTPADADKMVAFVRGFRDGKQVVELESGHVPKTTVPSPPELFPPPSDKAKSLPATVEKKFTASATSPELADRLRQAGVLYRQYCIVCHGTDGAGMPSMRVALPTLPDFTRPVFHEQHSDPQLLISILDGKGALMPANRGRVGEKQARDLVAYIRAFGPMRPGTASLAPNEFQLQFEQLQRQWEALERDLRALKSEPAKQP
jgi:mono/diheme cytochrome c family protein